MEFEQGRQASSCVEELNSACLLSSSWGDRLLVEYIWNLRLFPEDATGVSVPLCVVTQYLGFHLNQALSQVDGEIGVFGIVA